MRVRLLIGDCRSIVPLLPAESVHCCVTSPPYWGLRDYGVAGQIGLESTFQAFIAEMVAVFREVRRVLRHDGTLWLNMGDSYATGAGKVGDCPGGGAQGERFSRHHMPQTPDAKNPDAMVPVWQPNRMPQPGLKPKDLCGIPWRVAFALQEDGWWLRQDIIWSKPNPMPESVTDRCTKAHEYLFLLTKSARYFYDAEAIREPASETTIERWNGLPSKKRPDGLPTTAFVAGENTCGVNPAGRNKRSVWEIATSPFPEAHFATFPPALVEPCIKAGTSEKGCCGKCGAPWERQTSVEQVKLSGSKGRATQKPGHDNWDGWNERTRKDVTTLGWSPTCACQAAVVPCTVLDPFGGAGTTALVADRLQRNAILIELNPVYAEMGRKRVFNDAPLFAEATE